MDFYLGADTHWLATARVPLMVSHGRLRRVRNLPKAAAPWVCDSGAFTELKDHGRWRDTPEQYVDALYQYRDQIGQMVWAAPQDWMCEPIVISGGIVGNQRFVGTGLNVAEHQQRTVASVVGLRGLAPDLWIIPVLQGWTIADYLHCVALYREAGIDLTAEHVVGLGSVCRRQATGEIHSVVSVLDAMGIRLHGFGMKAAAVEAVGALLASADSQAWSYGARTRIGLCPHGLVKWEANCPEYARAWRESLLDRIGSVQLALPMFT